MSPPRSIRSRGNWVSSWARSRLTKAGAVPGEAGGGVWKKGDSPRALSAPCVDKSPSVDIILMVSLPRSSAVCGASYGLRLGESETPARMADSAVVSCAADLPK